MNAARAAMAAHRRAGALIALALAAAAPLSLADAPAATVRIEGYAFVPPEVVVRAGSVVRWENAEKRTSHSILFTGPGGFESDRLFPGEHYERRFDRPGRYAYGCGPHPEMRGVIVVEP